VSTVVTMVMARQKHSAKGGGRGRKGDVTPPDADRRKDIVEEIVNNLREGLSFKDHASEAEVTAYVNETLERMLKFDYRKAKKPFDRSLNRTHAKKLDSALTEVLQLWESAPRALMTHLRYSLSPWAEDEDRAWTEDEDRACRERENFLYAELIRLRERCALAINPGIGVHPNYGNAQVDCAWVAYDLMWKFSKRKITGTEDGTFRTIASLLYKAVFGRPTDDHDRITGLQRACKAVLRHARGFKR
jgi:hypothetical protein